ncbi:MAG: PQQ-dependent sugar dehydrogenase [Hyphomonadaceae bacterium]|nr:PQQ-dependent sugar dehydrogenase [Hyphomonadaceae bacterium]
MRGQVSKQPASETPTPANDEKKKLSFPKLGFPRIERRPRLRVRRRWILGAILLIGAYSGAVLAGGAAIGLWAERNDVPLKAERRLQEMIQNARTKAGHDTQVVEWRRMETNLHSLEVAAVRIGEGPTRGGGIAEIEGHILFASPHGRLSFLSAHNELAPLNVRVPMQMEALQASPLAHDALMAMEDFRVYDLYARQTAPGRYDLYVSHSAFVRENCLQFVISRVGLTADADGLAIPRADWKRVFVARPSCIPYKDHGWRFVGAEAGGRMVPLDQHTLLVTVGDHQFDGFNDTHRAAQDPAWDLGKLIALDLTTGRSRIFASGLRNPQGLIVMPDGAIWESEHGPLGGDEVNRIVDGGNYGWPLATYGVNYGFPRRPWPVSESFGRHDRFIAPAISFTPSIGASNLVTPDPREFPGWAGDLLMGTLKARTLFHMRPEGDRIAYAEPIEFDDRLRDLVSLRDGRIAILTDSSKLLFLRNAERHADAPREFIVTGLASLGSDPRERKVDQSGPVRGRAVFNALCSQCHSVTGETGVGPPLNGVVGRRVGSADFRYSRVMGAYRGVWTDDLLFSFLIEPNRHFRGTAMPATDIPWLDAPNVVEYLKTTR